MPIRNYIGFSRDHSGSMRSIARPAARDYNDNIASIREAAISNNQDTIVSVVESGYGNTDKVRRVVTNSAVTALVPLVESNYIADGRGTPLFDSVGELIEIFERVPDANDKDTSFLIMVITDGEENASVKYSAASISAKMRKLQATDRWSFIFRVPRGMKHSLVKMGIPEGNILEWDQSEKGVQAASAATREAFTQYYSARSSGATSTVKFYADLSNVTSKDVEAALIDISAKVVLWPVSAGDHDSEIRTFIEGRLAGKPLLKGAAFYQLVKTEPKVQDYKKIAIRDKTTNAIYGGDAARQMLGLPNYGDIRLAPDKHSNFDIFIQSTSVNRKVAKGTQVLYWAEVGVAYKEGISAR
jgi:hypothetical protein